MTSRKNVLKNKCEFFHILSRIDEISSFAINFHGRAHTVNWSWIKFLTSHFDVLYLIRFSDFNMILKALLRFVIVFKVRMVCNFFFAIFWIFMLFKWKMLIKYHFINKSQVSSDDNWKWIVWVKIILTFIQSNNVNPDNINFTECALSVFLDCIRKRTQIWI